jgi:hypothetical protein
MKRDAWIDFLDSWEKDWELFVKQPIERAKKRGRPLRKHWRIQVWKMRRWLFEQRRERAIHEGIIDGHFPPIEPDCKMDVLDAWLVTRYEIPLRLRFSGVDPYKIENLYRVRTYLPMIRVRDVIEADLREHGAA